MQLTPTGIFFCGQLKSQMLFFLVADIFRTIFVLWSSTKCKYWLKLDCLKHSHRRRRLASYINHFFLALCCLCLSIQIFKYIIQCCFPNNITFKRYILFYTYCFTHIALHILFYTYCFIHIVLYGIIKLTHRFLPDH